jgi:putative membrane protein
MKATALALCAALALAPGAHLAAAQTAPAMPDAQSFAEMAASSNLFEIESSQLALEMSDQDVLAVAEMMVQDHTLAGDNMMAAAKSDGVAVPTAMIEKHQSQLDQLQTAEEGAFDEAYLALQVAAHDDGVALFDGFSTQGEESALRNFAAETLPKLLQHQTLVHELAGS